MQIKYFFYIPSSMGSINEKFCKSCEGVLFDKDDFVDLRIYMEEFDSIIISYPNTLLVNSIALNITSRPICYDSLKEISLPYRVEGIIRRISYFDEQYVVFYERKKIGEQAYIVGSRANGRQAYISGLGGKLLIDDQHILIRRPDRVVCFDWNAEERWQYEIGKNVDGVYEKLIERNGD